MRTQKKSIDDLLNIMATLRGPSGCPWDRRQTRQTLKAYLIEEAYEMIEAIETGTPEDLKDELGDILLQIVFQSRIAQEKGQFSFADVVHALAEKLLRRHPHVFPTVEKRSDSINVRNAHDVTKVWRFVKEREGRYAKRRSVLDGLSIALPALERARRLSQRTSRAGLEWSDADRLLIGIEGKLRELGRPGRRTPRGKKEERVGDLLFLLTHWARLNGVSSEEALRKAGRRFAKRFKEIENSFGPNRRASEKEIRGSLAYVWEIP